MVVINPAAENERHLNVTPRYIPALEASPCPFYDMETRKTAKKRDFTDITALNRERAATLNIWTLID